MTTTAAHHPLLNQLGWQAYIPAVDLLLQRFYGTEAWVDATADTLPECLIVWLHTLTGADAKPLPLAMLALRRCPLLYFRAATGSQLWDYRQCSFAAFSRQAGENGLTVWFSPQGKPFPSLSQGLGFLRQHGQPG